MYAVDSEDGTPITYTIYRGGRVDSKELAEVIAYLHSYGIDTEGVILDRGFCNEDSIKLLKSVDLKYGYTRTLWHYGKGADIFKR